MSEIIIDIPNYSGWNSKRIDQLCSIARRGTAPVYVENSSIKAIGQRCVTHSDFDPSFARPHSENATSNILEAEKNDVLLNSTGTGTIGRSVIFNDSGKYIVDGHVTVLRPYKELVDSRWLNAVIRSKWFQRHLERFCYTGSTNQLELSRTYLNSSLLPTPIKEEQSQIGDVLDSIDTQIRETEAIIAKLQQVKQGLLHDLLTRGVDVNGELRPSYEDAPELYKPSELGWIPKNWDVVVLSELSDSGLMNGVFKEPSRVRKGIPLVNVADLYKGEEVNLDTCELFDATDAEKERYDVKKGDIFFTRSSLKLEGIAHTSFINCDCESVVFECHVMRLRPNPEKIIPLLLKEWCVGSFARKHFMANAKQVTMTTISQDGIRELPTPKPPLLEQLLMEKVIVEFEDKAKSELALLEKLKAKKIGLMDDLLTGKVRVTELINKQQAS